MFMPLIIGLFISAEPTAEQLAALKTFRAEFVELTPSTGRLKPFAIGKFEVTQDLWQAVMGANPSRWKGPRNSVEMLSLDEAQKFCEEATRLMRAAGLIEQRQSVRLP